ncbi:hypothetical protein B0I35DRAFT_8404 [Stachybotrys elegans]|uniref:Uncharacterized protein n=1 Tax=Stachybotrys elegans TaxID=80388 RepID=A0A8K0WXQ9_9HYPO|nr:hypothetical protein B0I35DRAFT_8404 [Stachybotrys elegans]
MESNSRHFWDLEEASCITIGKIAEKWPSSQDEDVVWHAWGAIPRVYFPSRSTGGLKYAVNRQAHWGLLSESLSGREPDNIAVRLCHIEQPQQGMPPSSYQRDVLWIECRASSNDTPAGWHAILTEAVEQLDVVHSPRKVYLIVAVGLKWLPFLWDPVASILDPSPLVILGASLQDTWEVDPRVHVIDPGALPGQRHVEAQNGSLTVNTQSAYSLDYWTLDQGGNPANLRDMLLLETFFALIRTTQFQSTNPDELQHC